MANIFSSLFGRGDPIKLEEQRTPGQIQSAQFLSQLGTTGAAGGLDLGAPFPGSLGDFDPTQFEKLGLSSLAGGITSPALSGAESTFSRLAGAAFDPSVLDPFTKAARKSGREAEDVLSREAAITGSRFGTGIQRRKGELAADVESGIQQKLAELFLSQQQVSLQGAAGLAGVGGQQLGQQQQNLQNLFGFGGLERKLKTQEAQANFAEFNRQRNEQLSRIDIAGSAAQLNPLLGISEIPGSPSPFSSLIGSVLGAAGKGFGTRIGGSIFDKIFPKSKKPKGSIFATQGPLRESGLF